MRKANILEAGGILSLSLLLTTSLSVSSCLPEMAEEFAGYSRSSLELMISVPAFAMMLVIASTSFLSRFLGERLMVVAGLLLFGIAGIVPVFTRVFEILFLSRILLGVGTGLVNTRAVSLIGERFTGSLRSRLQGVRCSMETLGQASLTLLAGQLLCFGWRYAFLIYGAAFPILAIYLAFVPAKPQAVPGAAGTGAGENGSLGERNVPAEDSGASGEGSASASVSSPAGKPSAPFARRRFILLHALLGGLAVSSSVCISIRMASFVVESGIGTATDGANILSLSVFSGFLGGMAFGKLLRHLGRVLLPSALALTALGLTAISFSDGLAVLAIGAAVAGFFCTCCISSVFNGLAERLPAEELDPANSAALVGCNLGSFATPLVLQAAALLNSTLSFGFLAYAAFLLAAALAAAASILYRKETPQVLP